MIHIANRDWNQVTHFSALETKSWSGLFGGRSFICKKQTLSIYYLSNPEASQRARPEGDDLSNNYVFRKVLQPWDLWRRWTFLQSVKLKEARSCESGGSPSEGHNPPRGSLRQFASQRALRGSLRGLCGVLSEGSSGSLRGSAGFSKVFRGQWHYACDPWELLDHVRTISDFYFARNVFWSCGGGFQGRRRKYTPSL